ncbi:MAG: GNAT family N-acetyltransferase [Anaerolineales bacterium]|nr:GNAT family N-acetyltransferase [Anaerolineales bacterium]MBX3035650.1 GNAT family N-acetyltransferase [Anaerolineales bacterium]
MPKEKVEIHPLTKDRWKDMVALFGEQGGYAGCWCMFWRLDRADFKKLRGGGTKEILHQMANKNQDAGLLTYLNKKPVGWCSIGPRENYVALENSRILKRVDDKPTWSIVCFFVDKSARKQGLMTHMVQGAVQHAKKHGAQFIEGYPIDMQSEKLAGQKLNSYAGYMGIAAAFREVGFVEAGRASETQLIMRYKIK